MGDAIATMEEKVKRERSTTDASLISSVGRQDAEPFTKLILWSLPRIIIIIYFIVLFVWIYQAEGGIGWTFDTVFGVHALCMSLFAVLLCTEAVLVFKSPLIPHKLLQNKYVHFFYHILGVPCLIVGLVAVVNYKNWSPQPVGFPFYTLYTPHALLGLVVLLLWGVHLMGGFTVFVLARKTVENNLPRISQVHRYLGKCIYVLLLVTCGLGLADMQSSDLAAEMAGEAPYGATSTLARLACAGVWLLAALGITVFANFEFL